MSNPPGMVLGSEGHVLPLTARIPLLRSYGRLGAVNFDPQGGPILPEPRPPVVNSSSRPRMVPVPKAHVPGGKPLDRVDTVEINWAARVRDAAERQVDENVRKAG